MMINEAMYGLGDEPSAIRELFAYGLARKAQIGSDKVYDFSIGNPNVPAPEAVKQAVSELLDMPPVALHGYTPAAGDPDVKRVIADSITRRFGIQASADNIYLTAGAAAALAISLSAVTHPGDQVIVPTPYFPEYATWISTARCDIVEVPVQVPSFQLDVAAIEAAITEKTSAIIVNSPNNPVGAVYTEAVLSDLAAMLQRKQQELGRQIFIICDEPYREIAYGCEVPYVPCLYANTIVCYSYSKSLSLPGERIGYIYVSDRMENAHDVSVAVAGAGRALGYVCAPSLMQRAIAKCIDEPSDVEAYRENRRLLTEGLAHIGYEFVQPDGAFYLWVKALEDDAQAFSDRAKEYELLIVPSDSFGVEGWVRISYCVAKETIVNSMPAFQKLFDSYQG